MARIVRIHWEPAEAASDAAALRAFRESPPELFVVDLTRLPSQGRDVGLYLRQQTATRLVPLVFAGGAPDKVARTKQTLPGGGLWIAWPKKASGMVTDFSENTIRSVGLTSGLVETRSPRSTRCGPV